MYKNADTTGFELVPDSVLTRDEENCLAASLCQCRHGPLQELQQRCLRIRPSQELAKQESCHLSAAARGAEVSLAQLHKPSHQRREWQPADATSTQGVNMRENHRRVGQPADATSTRDNNNCGNDSMHSVNCGADQQDSVRQKGHSN